MKIQNTKEAKKYIEKNKSIENRNLTEVFAELKQIRSESISQNRKTK